MLHFFPDSYVTKKCILTWWFSALALFPLPWVCLPVSQLCLTFAWHDSVVMSDIDLSCERLVLTQIARTHLAPSSPFCPFVPLLASLTYIFSRYPSQCSFICIFPASSFLGCLSTFFCISLSQFSLCFPYLAFFLSPLSLSLCLSPSIPLPLIWFLLLSKVTCGEQPLCCIQRERGGSTPGWEWKTLNWNICQATDYMIAAPLRHSGSCCLKSREHNTTSPLEQRGHTESKQ